MLANTICPKCGAWAYSEEKNRLNRCVWICSNEHCRYLFFRYLGVIYGSYYRDIIDEMSGEWQTSLSSQ